MRHSVPLVLLFWLACPALLKAQVDTAWIRRYNGAGDRADYFNGLAVDGSGNAYVTGASWVSGNGLDIVTMKYTPTGDTAWVRMFNGAGDSTDVGYRIALDRTGDVLIVGASIGNNSRQDFLTLKYDSLGTLLWAKACNGPSSEADVPNALAVDNSRNAYVTGRSHGGSTGYDYLTIKYQPNGDTSWVRRYTGTPTGYDEALGIGVDGSGNVYVTGRSYADSTRADYLTVKYSPQGDTLWTRRYDGNLGDDAASALVVESTGNSYITGKSLGSTGNDALTVSYAQDGTLRWARRYDGPAGGEDEGTGMTLDRFGNVAVCGAAAVPGDTTDAVLLKYDSLGTLGWARTYNGTGSGRDHAGAVTSDSLGNLYFAGRSAGTGTLEDIFTACWDSGGNRLWVQRYDGRGGYDEALALGLDSQRNVFVAGQSWGGATSWDGVLIKYRRVTGIGEEDGDMDARGLFLKTFGPSKEAFRFEYALPASGDIRIDAFDVRGARVSELFSGYRSAGTHDETRPLRLPAGIYFLRLSTGRQECFGKVVLLR